MSNGTNKTSDYHIPVLLKEAIGFLQVKPGEKYIDCTLGGGGHTRAILEAGGTVLGIDQDREALQFAEQNKQLAINNKQLTLKQGNFAHLKEIAKEAGFEQVAGILFDLGVSSHQLETGYRGFSFNAEAPLDMRMDQEAQTVMAADLINAAGEKELANLFWRYGEERDSKRIARAIVEARKDKRFETTDQLAKVVLRVSKKDGGRTHPATRVFQALRIAINDELNNLQTALPQAVELLRPGGRLVVISFHSLEDRIVKRGLGELGDLGVVRILMKRPIVPVEEEIKRNPRARSGKMRAAEKI